MVSIVYLASIYYLDAYFLNSDAERSPKGLTSCRGANGKPYRFAYPLGLPLSLLPRHRVNLNQQIKYLRA